MTVGTTKQNFSILIIDDSSAMRNITADVLESFGHTVYQAETGDQGVTIFGQKTVDLVILDVNMPDMNGPQTYRELLLIDPQVNVIVYSSESKTAVSRKFAPLAIPYFLHKPVDLTLLYETVEIAVRGSDLLLHHDAWQEEGVAFA